MSWRPNNIVKSNVIISLFPEIMLVFQYRIGYKSLLVVSFVYI